jgi:PilZ domain-containing protein
MQPNYPSVAKPCTSESFSGRPHFPAIENKKRTKRRKVTALKDVSEAGLAGSGPCRGVLPRSYPALAPKVQPWGEDGGGVRSDKRHGERRKWPRLPLAIPVFVRSRDDKGKEFLEFATALNVSAGGMLLVVRKGLPAAAEVLLEIPSAPMTGLTALPKTSRNLRAKALRSTQAAGCHLLGLKFARPLLNSNHFGSSKARKVGSAV